MHARVKFRRSEREMVAMFYRHKSLNIWRLYYAWHLANLGQKSLSFGQIVGNGIVGIRCTGLVHLVQYFG